MVLVLGLSPAVDVTYEVQHLVVGESHRVTKKTQKIGGKATNVANVLSQLGTKVELLITLGGLSGNWFKEQLAIAPFSNRVIEISAPTRTSITVFDGEATVINEEPAAISAEEFAAIKHHLDDLLSKHELLVISGRMPSGIGSIELTQLIQMAKNHGVKVAVDTTGSSLIDACKAQAWLVKPNQAELLEATGESSIDAGLAKLFSFGVENVLLSKGSAGIELHRNSASPLSYSLGQTIAGNPTGAGDASLAGFISAKQKSMEDTEALVIAAAAGAAAVAMPVAGQIDIKTFNTLKETT